MKRKWIVSADSGFDLTPDVKEKYDIRTQNIWVILGERSGKDCEFTQKELYDYADATGKLPQTGALSPTVYEETFRSYLEEAEKVVHVSLSSGISSCNQNACIAASEIDGVYVIDSKNLSTGFGHLVYKLCELLEGGMEVEDAVAAIEALTEKVDASFVLNTLEYMKKGGRCSTVAALGANLLKLKPCIEVKDGKMGVCKKYRGNLKDVLQQYVSERLADLESIDNRRIFITHSGIDADIEKSIYEQVKALDYFEEILITTASSTIATHCGPNTLGVLFIKK